MYSDKCSPTQLCVISLPTLKNICWRVQNCVGEFVGVCFSFCQSIDSSFNVMISKNKCFNACQITYGRGRELLTKI